MWYTSTQEAASTADYPFGQVPALRDEDGTMYCQQDAIMRHIGRQHGLCGSSLQEAALVDMVMAGVEDIRRAYINLIYQVCHPIIRWAAWRLLW